MQPKLTVGAPDDAYEREADRVADAVMRMPAPDARIQRMCPECEDELQRQPADEMEDEELLAAKSRPGQTPEVSDGVEARIQSLRGGGRPLPEATRAFFEPRFGEDFSGVRVHTDPGAAHLARTVQARAFTVGRDIVFGPGEYRPGSAEGRSLLAHELTHVIQQRGLASGPQRKRLPKLRTGGDVLRQIVHGASWVARQTPGETEPPVAEPAEGGAGASSACPVQAEGTLSEVSWGETSGIYPSSKNKYQPEKWDAAKTCELLKMRGAVHAVGQRGERVHKGKPKKGDALEQKLKLYHLVENFPTLDSEIADENVKWFFLSPNSESSHPGISGEKRVKTYGKFYNVGGGDVAKGDVYIHFFKVES